MATKIYDSMPTSIPEGEEYVMIKDSDSSSKDLSVLSGVRGEVVLEGFEHISDLTPLANCQSVIFINCNSDLPVECLKNVRSITLVNCPRVNGINSLTGLRHLTLHNMKRIISESIKLPNLDTVCVSNTNVSFANCSNIKLFSSKWSPDSNGNSDTECKAFSVMHRYSNGGFKDALIF